MIDVHALRDALGLTQAGFGYLMGFSAVTVSRWENGHAEPEEGALKLRLLEEALRLTSPSIVRGALLDVAGEADDPVGRDVALVRALVRLGEG